MTEFGLFFLFLVMKTENIHYSGAYASMGIDNSLRLDEFKKNFKVKVIKLNEDDMEFDLIGIDASIANAFRRILISEVFSSSSSTSSSWILKKIRFFVYSFPPWP